MTTRKARGAATQRLVATYLREHGYPWAQDAGAGRPGTDILGVAGVDWWEVKARRDFDPMAWLRQCGNGLTLVTFRPDGAGPTTVADWPTIVRLGTAVWLLRAAGFGEELTHENDHGLDLVRPVPPVAPAAPDLGSAAR